MHVAEVVVSGEKKRSDGAYGSDARFASFKLVLYPGEDVGAAIARGQELVRQALGESVATTSTVAPASVPRAPEQPSPVAGWHVRVEGAKTPTRMLTGLGLRFVEATKTHEAFFQTEEGARRCAKSAELLASAYKATITPPEP